MIGKQTLKDYGYTTIQEYYDYIIESIINGNHSQVRELIKAFTSDQRKDFAKWVVDSRVPEKDEILLAMV